MIQDKYHVITLETPTQKVVGLRKTIDVSQTHDLFQELYGKIAALGLKRSGVTQLLYHGQEFNYEAMDVEAQAEVSGESAEALEREPVLCAAVIHTGPYSTLRYAYDALNQWLKQHPEYQCCGPAIERYIKDEQMVLDEEELETGILFPIRKTAE